MEKIRKWETNLITLNNIIMSIFESKDDKTNEKTFIAQQVFHNLGVDKVELILYSDVELVQEDGKYFIVNKKLKYPKTYIECCKILDTDASILICGYKSEILEKLQKLLICRDAYWKIDNDWKPKRGQNVFYFYYPWTIGEIKKTSGNLHGNVLFPFPSCEARDAFYQNFKDLINECKELL